MPLDVFISYSPKDRELQSKLAIALSNLRNQKLIRDWHDEDISPGAEWKKQILAHLDQAHIILLLISPDFMASEFCYSIEMQHAIARHDNNQARVIPIILRPTDWEGTPFEKLLALPTDGRPITSWPDQDQAFLDVIKGIRRAMNDLNTHLANSPASVPTESSTKPMGIETEQVAVWNVPFQKNPYFTGREDVLTHLHETLVTEKNVALTQPRVISGLGGIGKTQLAIEYAYRYRNDYQYVFWVRADTYELLVSDFNDIANSINLSIKDEKDQGLIVGAVKNWLQTYAGWLLIFDNADDLEGVRNFLPKQGKGHVLLTTRAPVLGIEAQGIELDAMKPEESDLFLLRRAKLLALDASLDTVSDIDRRKAQEIVETMGNLPLALVQAGAYIERTQCGLSGYLERYQKRRAELLKERSGLASDHPEPVATTWSLSFEKVEQTNPAAADLLRLCAFLHPDAIPEEILIDGASALTQALQAAANDVLALDNAIVELRRYSLIRRNLDAKTLTIHRLVQAVLKDTMHESYHYEWAERAVRVVNVVFPKVQFSTWERCQLYLPHVQLCAELIKQWNMGFPEAARLLNDAGYYLSERGQYPEAEALLKQALTIREKMPSPELADIAQSQNNLAEVYRLQGKYAQALPLFEQSLASRKQILGPEHPDVASTLNNIAKLYFHQAKYPQAEQLYQRALALREKALGSEHPDVALTLSNMATNYSEQGKYSQAEPLYRQALAIQEKALGSEHPNVAHTPSSMATYYNNQGKYPQAEQLYRRLYTLYLRTLGPGHIKTMEAMKLCTAATQKVRQRNNAPHKTKRRGKKHR